MRLSLIVAMTRSGVIGRGGKLPWRLSADLKRFKSLTMGHHLILGRKTYESLPRPLPGRTLVVLTRRPAAHWMNVTAVNNLDDALHLGRGDREVFVIGGGEIYRLALPRVERMYVTWVEAEVVGDILFPDMDWRQWQEVERQSVPADARNEFETTFCIHDRIAPLPAA